MTEPGPPTAAGRELDLASASVDAVLAALGVDPAHGLGRAEVARRLREDGYNEVPEPEAHSLRQFLRKFWGLSAWMLELILVLSWVLHRFADLVIVSGLLVVNAIVSVLQEGRASRAVEALRARLRVTARVRREGTWQVVPARELVRGDLVRLRAGDIVPADVRLLAGELTVDQSALTGESLDIRLAAGAPAYSGSLVRRGEAEGVVILTGRRTYFGRTTELVATARPKLHVEVVVGALVRWLFLIVAGLLTVAFIVARWHGTPLLELLPLMLVLLLSAVPVALPVMFTVSMAVGAMELARRGVLVTRLGAAEDAATMDVLCVDKTGTVTMNRLSVTDVLPAQGHSAAEILRAAALASEPSDQDPIDLAVLVATRAAGLPEAGSRATRLSFTPFDPTTRRTEAVIAWNGTRGRVVKGAAATVAAACRMDQSAGAAVEARVRAEAARGYRVLGVAQGPEAGPLTWLGLLTLSDPPRPDAPRLIEALRARGVRVLMLTGDAQPIAQEVARRVGLGAIRPLHDLASRAEGSPVSGSAADVVDGYAEVFPEDKYRVVRAFQEAGHVVGMTGDGVNDAPALRQAEVGIAVSRATDVAKGAASVVLVDEGLVNIVALVEQGRVIYQRVLTWIINKISRTLLKAGVVTVALLATGQLVVSPLGMILLVFLTDFAKIALATDRVEGSPQPERWALAGPAAAGLGLGLLMIAEMLGLLAFGWHAFDLGRDPGRLHTFSFQALLFFALFSVLSIRERRRFWASRPSPVLAGALAGAALAGTLLSTIGLPGLTPVSWPETGTAFAIAMICSLGVNDPVKVALIRVTLGRVPATAATGARPLADQGGIP